MIEITIELSQLEAQFTLENLCQINIPLGDRQAALAASIGRSVIEKLEAGLVQPVPVSAPLPDAEEDESMHAVG